MELSRLAVKVFVPLKTIPCEATVVLVFVPVMVYLRAVMVLLLNLIASDEYCDGFFAVELNVMSPLVMMLLLRTMPRPFTLNASVP